jgi:hypothetical protein
MLISNFSVIFYTIKKSIIYFIDSREANRDVKRKAIYRNVLTRFFEFKKNKNHQDLKYFFEKTHELILMCKRFLINRP